MISILLRKGYFRKIERIFSQDFNYALFDLRWCRLARKFNENSNVSVLYRKIISSLGNSGDDISIEESAKLFVLGDYAFSFNAKTEKDLGFLMAVLKYVFTKKYYYELVHSFRYLEENDPELLATLKGLEEFRLYLGLSFIKIGYRNIACEFLKGLEHAFEEESVGTLYLENANEREFLIYYKNSVRNSIDPDHLQVQKCQYYLNKKKFQKVIDQFYLGANAKYGYPLIYKVATALTSEFRYREAEDLYSSALKSNIYPLVVTLDRYFSFLLHRGDFEKLSKLVSEYKALFLKNESLFRHYINFLWLTGREKELNEASKKFVQFVGILSPQLVEFSVNRARQGKGFAILVDAAHRTLETRRMLAPHNHLLVSSMLERWDQFDESKEPFWPGDYEAFAKMYFAKGNNLKLKETLLKVEKYVNPPWAVEYWTYLYMHEDDSRIESVLKKRSEYIWGYRYKTEDGYSLINDPNLQAYLWRNNRYAEGIKLNFSRNISRFLKRKYPTKYWGGELTTKHIENSEKILIIGNDGVGDEVRWSRHWSILEDENKEIHVTCDPRLMEIFSKSYPDFKFYPVHRRWTNIKLRDKLPRVKSEIRDLSNLLTDDIAENLDLYDLIIINQELVYLSWTIRPPSDLFEESSYLTFPKIQNCNYKSRFEKDKLKIGLVLSSHITTPERRLHYLAVNDLCDEILKNPNYEFHMLSNVDDLEDRKFLESFNVKIWDDIDFYNDFVGMANFMENLDVCVGVSTLTSELASSIGVLQFLLGVAPESKYYRQDPDSGNDLLTIKTKVLCPDKYNIPRAEKIIYVNDKLRHELDLLYDAKN